jgi:hypothetical protein
MSAKVIRQIHLPEFCSRNFFDICDGVADANNSPLSSSFGNRSHAVRAALEAQIKTATP